MNGSLLWFNFSSPLLTNISLTMTTNSTAVCGLTLGLIALISNVLVCLVLAKGSEKKLCNFRLNAFQKSIGNIIFSFFFVCLITYSQAISGGHGQFNFNACEILMIGNFIGIISIPSQSICLSLDRLAATVFPIFYYKHIHTTYRSCFMNAFMWVLSLTLGVFWPLFSHQLSPNRHCTEDIVSPEYQKPLMNILLSFMVFSFSNYFVILVVKSTHECLNYKTKDETVKHQIKTDIKVMRTTGLIATCQFFFWVVPFSYLVIVQDGSPKSFSLFLPYCLCLTQFNSCMSLPIYLISVEGMRSDFLNLFRVKRIHPL